MVLMMAVAMVLMMAAALVLMVAMATRTAPVIIIIRGGLQLSSQNFNVPVQCRCLARRRRRSARGRPPHLVAARSMTALRSQPLCSTCLRGRVASALRARRQPQAITKDAKFETRPQQTHAYRKQLHTRHQLLYQFI